MSQAPSQPDRVVELETLLMHLQRDLAALSEVVIDQQKQLDAQGRRLARLDERLVEPQTPAEPRDVQAERPPHY